MEQFRVLPLKMPAQDLGKKDSYVPRGSVGCPAVKYQAQGTVAMRSPTGAHVRMLSSHNKGLRGHSAGGDRGCTDYLLAPIFPSLTLIFSH